MAVCTLVGQADAEWILEYTAQFLQRWCNNLKGNRGEHSETVRNVTRFRIKNDANVSSPAPEHSCSWGYHRSICIHMPMIEILDTRAKLSLCKHVPSSVTTWKNVSKRGTLSQDRLGRRRTNGEQTKYWSKCTLFATGGLAPAATATEDQINSMILSVSSILQCVVYIALSIWKIYWGGSLSAVPCFGTSEPVIFNRKSVVWWLDEISAALNLEVAIETSQTWINR